MSTSSTTASAFSTLDTAALEREVELQVELPATFEQIWNETHKKVSSGWIRQNGYKRVCTNLIEMRNTTIDLPF